MTFFCSFIFCFSLIPRDASTFILLFMKKYLSEFSLRINRTIREQYKHIGKIVKQIVMSSNTGKEAAKAQACKKSTTAFHPVAALSEVQSDKSTDEVDLEVANLAGQIFLQSWQKYFAPVTLRFQELALVENIFEAGWYCKKIARGQHIWSFLWADERLPIQVRKWTDVERGIDLVVFITTSSRNKSHFQVSFSLFSNDTTNRDFDDNWLLYACYNTNSYPIELRQRNKYSKALKPALNRAELDALIITYQLTI